MGASFQREICERRLTDLVWKEAHILVQIHDEIVAEAPEEIAQEFSDLTKYQAENALKLDIPIIFEVGIADDWETAKP